jgi:drug/metabolite transporter (DMT)-like permease
MQSHLASIVMLVVTMVIWGSTFVVTKGINEQVQPFTLAFVRVAIGALVLLACAFVRQARGGGNHARWSALPWGTMFTMGLVGVVLYYAVFNYSLVYTSASQGALVQSCIPAMTALVAVVWLREHASVLRWAGIVLSMVGVLIVFSGSAGQSGGTLLGNFLMFVSAVLWGVYTSMAKRVATYDPLQVTAGIIGAGAVLLLPLAAFEIAAAGMPSVDVRGWLGMAYLGAGASGLGYMLYSAALKHVDASEAGVYTNLIPIVGVLTGVMLGEPLSARAIVGGLVVLVGVWLTSRQPAISQAKA